VQPLRFSRALLAWVRAARLQFYPLPLATYAAGALAAGGSLRADVLAAGAACVFLIELLTVLANEVFDYPSDAVNENAGPFTGGSRVLVERTLGVRALRRGAGVVLLLAVCVGVWLTLASPRPAAAVAFLLAAFVLGLGYTVPPLSLCHRGLGELTVGLASGPLPLLFGYASQGGPLSDPFPWLLGLPLFLAVLQANLLAGLPDYTADRRAGKRSVPVVLGPRAAVFLSMAAAILAVAAFGALWPAGRMHLLSPLWLAPVAGHAAALIGLQGRHLRSRRLDTRIDIILAASLAYILWFGALPLAEILLRS
jgi:1,4-dihydroxy-2-naphthoate octaprenyltransferase